MRYLIFILLIGCTQHHEIKTIDGCEYIIIKDQYGKINAITHKGNCINEIHEYNYDVEEDSTGFYKYTYGWEYSYRIN